MVWWKEMNGFPEKSLIPQLLAPLTLPIAVKYFFSEIP
jgi:hypothetical protein